MPRALLTTSIAAMPRLHAYGRPSRRLLALLSICLGGLGTAACFSGEALVYAPCRSSEACQSADLIACVVRPDLDDEPGFCAPACASPCPDAPDGDARPVCLEIDGSSVCALECDADVTCPESFGCAEVTDADDEARMLCFPGARATP